MTLHDLIAAFMSDAAPGKTASTVKGMWSKFGQLERGIGGDVQASAITRRDLIDLQKQMIARLSPFTVQSTWRVIRQLFAWAATEGHIATDPASTVRSMARPRVEPKAVEASDFDKLLAAARDKSHTATEAARNVALIMMLGYTGARISEVLRMDWRDIEHDRERIIVSGKGGKARFVYPPRVVLDALTTWGAAQKRDGAGPIFTSREGNRLAYDPAYKILKRLSIRAGITSRHNPHGLRHAFALAWLREGGGISRLQATLGHSTPKVTMDYYSTFDDRAVSDANRQFGPGRSKEERKGRG